MPKTKLTGYIQFPTSTTQAELKQITQELSVHTKLTLQEAGCISFSVIQDNNDKFRFDVNEVFIDTAAFEAHQLRVKGSDWFKVSQLATRHYTIIKNKLALT